MNTDNSNAAPDDNVPESCQTKPGGCPFRKCRRVLLILLLLIVVGAGVGYWWFFVRVHNLKVYQSAMQRIQADKPLQEELGQPIQAVNWPPPSSRIEEQEIDIRWPIQGSKPIGIAHAHVLVQRRLGEWQMTVLEVTLPNGKRLAIRDEENTEDDAPLFNQAPKPDETKPEQSGPAPDINMQIPDGVPGADGK